MTLSQRLRRLAATVGIGSLANEHEGNAATLKQAHDVMREAADRLDALAKLRPRLEALRGVIGVGITPCQDTGCEHCQADVTLRDLLALLPEEE